jgi:hypothetical protein
MVVCLEIGAITSLQNLTHISNYFHLIRRSTVSLNNFFFKLNLHSGGWNQGPLDTAAT